MATGGRLSSVPGAAREDIADRIDLDVQPASRTQPTNRSRTSLSSARQGEPAQTGVAEAADLAGPLYRRPQPLGIDLEGIDRAHRSLRH